MSPLFTFILGLLIGWLIEWAIDYFYWRRRYEESSGICAPYVPKQGCACDSPSYFLEPVQ